MRVVCLPVMQVPGRLPVQCKRFTENEDLALRDAVASHGTGKWKDIAAQVSRSGPSRTREGCQLRWEVLLSTDCRKTTHYSEEEDRAILLATRAHVSWKDFALSMPGRSSKSLQNRAFRLKKMAEA